jgi:hypothetical protein
MEDVRFVQGQIAERRRLATLLQSPLANGRERAAIELAFNSVFSVEEAIALLATTPARGAERAPSTQQKGNRQ